MKKIPLTNYLKLLVVIIITIVILIYGYFWYNAYKDTEESIKILTPYFDIINYNELDSYVMENSYFVIYVSTTNNSRIRGFESRLTEIIEDNSKKFNILYLDITEEMKDDKISREIESKYYIGNTSILDVPCVAIFREGHVTSIVTIDSLDYDENIFYNLLLSWER